MQSFKYIRIYNEVVTMVTHRCLQNEKPMGVHIVNNTFFVLTAYIEKFGDKLNKGRGNLSQCDNSAHFVYMIIMIITKKIKKKKIIIIKEHKKKRRRRIERRKQFFFYIAKVRILEFHIVKCLLLNMINFDSSAHSCKSYF